MRKLVKMIQKIRSQQNLGCYIVSRDPLILMTYWHDFIYKHKDQIFELISEETAVTFIFQLGYYKTAENALEIKEHLNKILKERGNVRFIFLNNTEEEDGYFQEADLETYFINQNCFLDEKRYHIYPHLKKQYQAVYLARMTPAKRHFLAADIPDMLMIGSYFDHEIEYVNDTLSKITYRKWIKKIPHFLVSRYLNKAYVGLSLSDVEGAMFVSTEYFLCGLPQISTRSVGGRDVYFNDYNTIIVDDDSVSVAKGLAEMLERKIDPVKIRSQVVEIMNIHRNKFKDLICEIFNSVGKKVDKEKLWEEIFTHKMGLRIHVPKCIYGERILKPGMDLEVK